jgi:Flp pilus assembly protein TadG
VKGATVIPTRIRTKSERGTALIETAVVLPMILLVGISIFEFGRAFETWQVMTNAAREGARVAVLPSATSDQVKERVTTYLKAGVLVNVSNVNVAVDSTTVSLGGGVTAPGTQVTLTYPFQFIVLKPIAQLVTKTTTLGRPLNLTAQAVMRNE